MGQVIIWYVIFIIEFLILLTAAANLQTALWTLGFVYTGCFLGICVWVWWERKTQKIVKTDTHLQCRAGDTVPSTSNTRRVLLEKILWRCGGIYMRAAMERCPSAVTNVLSHEETLQPVRSKQHGGNASLLLIEQVAYGGQRAALRWSSEYRLLLAVLQDAVACWFRCCHAQNGRERRMFQEIHAWFWDKTCDWLYAFESICEHLDLDPDAIRRGLMQWQATSQHQPMSMVQMRRVRRHRKIRPLCEIDEDEF